MEVKLVEEIGPEIHKTVPILRNTSLNPSCAHGPSILFERKGTRFFSCSAFRSRKLCPFYMDEKDWDPEVKVEKLKKPPPLQDDNDNDSKMMIVDDPHEAEGQSLGGPSPRKKLRLEKSVNLPIANQRDQGEAQYHFNDNTTAFLLEQFENCNLDSILCIGTPSLHQAIRNKLKGLELASFLLDIDERFEKLYLSEEYAKYNMCNHHFFAASGKKNYEGFLKQSRRLGIIADPPFGAKVELIWFGGLSGVIKDLLRIKEVEKDKDLQFEIFWIFPYFMEGHILSKCQNSGLQMSDFKVEYTNHKKFSIRVTGKPSPVRVFTTAPLSKIVMSSDAYRYCDICCKWVDKFNLHCQRCKVCPTKDGGHTYNHCKKCKKCVKPTWFHCSTPCGKCHLKTLDCKLESVGKNKKSSSSNTLVGLRNVKKVNSKPLKPSKSRKHKNSLKRSKK